MRKLATPFILRDGMSLQAGEKVEVYYNLNQGGFSILSRDKRNPNKGKVVAYARHVVIDDATFHLNLRILEQIRTKRVKNVYAVVRGTLRHCEAMDDAGFRKGYCNPYTTGKFIDWESKEQLTAASTVYFYDKFFSYQN